MYPQVQAKSASSNDAGATFTSFLEALMTFGVEQGMTRDYLLSADALIALSGLRSALDILEDHRSTRRTSSLLWQQTPARISKLLAPSSEISSPAAHNFGSEDPTSRDNTVMGDLHISQRAIYLKLDGPTHMPCG
jgi:hypothetical protein